MLERSTTSVRSDARRGRYTGPGHTRVAAPRRFRTASSVNSPLASHDPPRPRPVSSSPGCALGIPRSAQPLRGLQSGWICSSRRTMPAPINDPQLLPGCLRALLVGSGSRRGPGGRGRAYHKTGSPVSPSRRNLLAYEVLLTVSLAICSGTYFAYMNISVALASGLFGRAGPFVCPWRRARVGMR
jgi:hypothetical protein